MKKRLKTLLFSLIPVTLLLLTVEFGGRFIYFQNNAPHPSVFHQISHQLGGILAREKVKKRLGTEELPTRKQFFSEKQFDDKLRQAAEEYRQLFFDFVERCRVGGFHLVILYIPPPEDLGSFAHGFFKSLAEERNLPLVDMKATFARYPDLALYGERHRHPTAFANHLTATALTDHLRDEPAGATPQPYPDAARPKRLGDLDPNVNGGLAWDLKTPFWLTTNSQGLRRDSEVKFPKEEGARILVIGDSFTFGHGINDYETYPHYLEGMLPGTEVINAGVATYSLYKESLYLINKGRFLEPDIVILQVLDNDLHELLPAMQALAAKMGIEPPKAWPGTPPLRRYSTAP